MKFIYKEETNDKIRVFKCESYGIYKDYNLKKLLELQEKEAKRVEEGRDILGRKILTPNPELARKYREMKPREFWASKGIRVICRKIEEIKKEG